MGTWSRSPHAALRGLVGPYVGYDEELDPRLVHHGVPSPTITLVWSFGDPIDVGWVGDGLAGTRRMWSMAAGLHLRPALVLPHGRQRGIQASLTPAGCRLLLGMPAGVLAGDVVDLAAADDLVGRVTHERLDEQDDWEARFDLLDEALLAARTRHDPTPGADLARAWHLLARPERPGVEAVAADIGRSPRWLSGRFAAEYGVPPVQVARLHRFARALDLARGGRSLADVAAATGYADQAHLSRDWKTLAGLTPTALLRSPYRILQDEERPGPRR